MRLGRNSIQLNMKKKKLGNKNADSNHENGIGQAKQLFEEMTNTSLKSRSVGKMVCEKQAYGVAYNGLRVRIEFVPKQADKFDPSISYSTAVITVFGNVTAESLASVAFWQGRRCSLMCSKEVPKRFERPFISNRKEYEEHLLAMELILSGIEKCLSHK